MKEIGNKSREFYEFVLPPIDMHLTDENLKVVIDIPGISKKDIKLTLCGDILSIKAKKVMDEKDSKTLISNQRPNMINKKIRLPIEIKEGEIIDRQNDVENINKKIGQLEKEKEKYGINAAQANAKYA